MKNEEKSKNCGIRILDNRNHHIHYESWNTLNNVFF